MSSLTLVACLVAALSGSALALPASVPHVVHEQRDGARSDWTKRDRVEKSAILPIRIALSQTNLDRAHDMLMDL